MSPEVLSFLTMYIFQNKTNSNFSLDKTSSHSHEILKQMFVSRQWRGKQSVAFVLTYVIPMWLHVTNATNWQVCQCCTCTLDSGSHLYPLRLQPKQHVQLLGCPF